MTQFLMIYIIVLELLTIGFVVYFFKNFRCKSMKQIEQKYGKPIEGFRTRLCWKTLPIKGSSVIVNIYPEFLLISNGRKDLLISRTNKKVTFYKSMLYACLEVEDGKGKHQVEISLNQMKILKEYFNVVD